MRVLSSSLRSDGSRKTLRFLEYARVSRWFVLHGEEMTLEVQRNERNVTNWRGMEGEDAVVEAHAAHRLATAGSIGGSDKM